MQSSSNEKTLNAAVAKQDREEGTNRSSNPFQKEEITMNTKSTGDFNTRLSVNVGFYGTATVEPVTLLDNSAAVSLDFGDEGGIKTISPAAACALATALQGAAIYAMEETDTEAVAA